MNDDSQTPLAGAAGNSPAPPCSGSASFQSQALGDGSESGFTDAEVRASVASLRAEWICNYKSIDHPPKRYITMASGTAIVSDPGKNRYWNNLEQRWQSDYGPDKDIPGGSKPLLAGAGKPDHAADGKSNKPAAPSVDGARHRHV